METNRNVTYYVAASAAFLTFLVYLPALRNQFVYWDDNLYVFENPNIRSLDAGFFRWAFFGFHVSNWHPLTWISHAVDYALWGLNPLGHHLTNIVLHAINTALVVMLALKLLEFVRERSARKGSGSFLNNRTFLIAAGTTGLLFGIHPVHVESVAWVAERKDLLCALFFLLSVLAYANAVRRTGHSAESKRLTPGSLLSALCFFILALMSKPMAVSLPVVLLILDWYPFNRIRSLKMFRASIVEKLPFIFLSLLSSLLTILAQREGNSMASLAFVPLSTRLLVAGQSLVGYLEKMLLPLNLTPLYIYPKDVSLFSFKYVSTLFLVLGITAACAVLARKRKFCLSVWGFYVVTLIPVLGIIQVGNQPMADRYAYLPSLGPFLLAGVGAAWISEKSLREKQRGFFLRGFSVAMALMLVCCLSILTVRQTAIWKDSLSLWTYVIEKGPGKIPLAYNNRGMVFFKAGVFDKAIADFDQAIGMDPEYAKAYYNRGSTYDKMGELDKAIVDYRKTISLDPYYYEAHYFLDQALKKTGLVDQRTR
jgi:energy-converting hydrogenase Eha subunit A